MIAFTHLTGCADSDGEPKDPGPGSRDTSADEVTPAASQAGRECGDMDCEADLEAAMSLLEEGRFNEAFDEYSCGDTAEAAFGAALTKMITLVESEGASRFLERAGYIPMKADELAGPGSALYQNGHYWLGGGRLSVQGGDLDVSFELDRVHTDFDEGFSLTGHTEWTDADYDLWIGADLSIPLSTGDTFEFQPECDGEDEDSVVISGPSDDGFWLDVDMETGDGAYYYCSTTSMPPSCPDRPGAITAVAIGNEGDPIAFQLTDVPLRCRAEESYGDGDMPTVSRPLDEDEYFLAYLSGTVESLWTSADILTGDFHPVIDDPEEVWEHLPMSLTVNDLASDASALAGDIALAACYAEGADNGNAGPVFIIPESLHGHRPIPITTSDAKLVASHLHAVVAAIRMAESYDWPLRIRALEEMSTPDMVEEINRTVPALRENHRFGEAKESLSRSLALLIGGLSHLEEVGYLQRRASGERGREQLIEWAEAVLDSVEHGGVTVPASDPPIVINLKALFDSPPDPSGLDVDPLVLEEDEWGDEVPQEVEAFWQQLLGENISDFDFNMEDNRLFEDPDESLELFFEEILWQSCYLFGC